MTDLETQICAEIAEYNANMLNELKVKKFSSKETPEFKRLIFETKNAVFRQLEGYIIKLEDNDLTNENELKVRTTIFTIVNSVFKEKLK